MSRKKWPLKRGVRLWEVKNVDKCLYVAKKMTKCPLTRGVRRRTRSPSKLSLTFRQKNKENGQVTITRM